MKKENAYVSTGLSKRIYELVCEELNRFRAEEIPQDVFGAICTFLPQIVNYVEEDRRFSFKMAVGTKVLLSPYGDCYFIKETQIDKLPKDSLRQSLAKAIAGDIKNAAPFCNTFSNIILRYDVEKHTIQVGIYTARQEAFRNQDQYLMENGYVIFAPARDTGVLVTGRGAANSLYIPLDLGMKQPDEKLTGINEPYHSRTCRIWDGLFERVRTEVHGTICLVVDEDYEFTKDKNFTDGCPVPPFHIIGSGNNMDLFISMLNYDGVTIINTEGKVLVYHAKSKIDKRRKARGGLRHQAYANLKGGENPPEHYVGIYFQSQEGEIRFFDCKQKAENSRGIFDCKIMMPGGIDSDFVDFVEDSIQMNRNETDGNWKEARQELTDVLREFYAMTEEDLENIEDAVEHGRIGAIFADGDWTEYFDKRCFLDESLLCLLKDPGKARHGQKLRACFGVWNEELDDQDDVNYLFVALDSSFLRYTHLDFEDMYHELKRRQADRT